jgi:hypothetical protein
MSAKGSGFSKNPLAPVPSRSLGRVVSNPKKAILWMKNEKEVGEGE